MQFRRYESMTALIKQMFVLPIDWPLKLKKNICFTNILNGRVSVYLVQIKCIYLDHVDSVPLFNILLRFSLKRRNKQIGNMD